MGCSKGLTLGTRNMGLGRIDEKSDRRTVRTSGAAGARAIKEYI